MSVLDKFVYKPLDMSLDTTRHRENHEDDDYYDDEDDENVNQPFTSSPIHHVMNEQQHFNYSNFAYLNNLLNLHQLRIVLYLTASLLAVIFVIQLISSEADQASVASPVSLSLKSPPQDDHSISDQNFSISEQQAPGPKSNTIDYLNSTHYISTYPPPSNVRENNLDFERKKQDLRPIYTSYLTSILHEHNLKKSHTKNNSPSGNDPIDDLDFPGLLDDSGVYSSETRQRVPLNSRWWVTSTRDSGKYITLMNYIRAMKSFSYNTSITLTTQATTEFIYHTLELCKRWDGPISVAIFAPGSELVIAISLIKFMRQCLPGLLSNCIKDKVTWHIAYNQELGPEQDAVNYPRYYMDSKNYPLFVQQNHCPKFSGPEPSDLIKQFLQDLNKSNNPLSTNLRKQYKLPYPINVLRNTARIAANTRYILASDIELYPSINLVPSFENFLANHNVKAEYKFEKFVFVLPIFEVDSSFNPPMTKLELTNLMQKGHAVFFHKYVCDACQNFPNRLNWLLTDKHGVTDYRSSDNELTIFYVTQRTQSREWEPIFIGTNEEPYYDDRLTWEGRRDKMGQMYEMCLLDYHLLILGNAFLVHAPGIKRIDKNDLQKRLNYLKGNNAIYDVTMSNLRQHHASSKNINKC